jgi:hypothetical protein
MAGKGQRSSQAGYAGADDRHPFDCHQQMPIKPP